MTATIITAVLTTIAVMYFLMNFFITTVVYFQLRPNIKKKEIAILIFFGTLRIIKDTIAEKRNGAT